MKYYLVLVVSLFLVVGCDDGDLITENFNFSTAQIQKCADSNTLYKLNAQEALILNIDEINFPNEVTEANKPRVVAINSSASIQYRKYSGAVLLTSICDSPAPSNPVVLEEWNVSGGNVEITTTAVYNTDGTTIIAYNHNIIFKNITFVTADKQIAYDSYTYGDFRTEVVFLPFNFSTAVTQKCDTKNLIFRYNDNEVLLLELNTNLFPNAATVPGSPREEVIDGVTNNVIYRIYSGSLNANFFCASIPPSTPTLTEEWTTENGVASVSGLVRVETVALNTTTFEHTIKLYKTTFKNGIKTYSPAPTGEYTFGTYRTTSI